MEMVALYVIGVECSNSYFYFDYLSEKGIISTLSMPYTRSIYSYLIILFNFVQILSFSVCKYTIIIIFVTNRTCLNNSEERIIREVTRL